MYKLAFLLLPNFQMLGVISAIETLRVANSLYTEPPFEWVLVHDMETPVRSSAGLGLDTSGHVSDLQGFDALIVSSSFSHDAYQQESTLSLLRRYDRHGKTLGSIESGVYHLAKAGVMDGHTATSHFNNLPLFAQLFPKVSFVRRVFTFSDRRMTCAGGSACIDMMLHLIAKQLGALVAARVANIIIYPYRRDVSAPQDDLFTSAYNGLQPVVRDACREMEAAIEEPLSIGEIAAKAKVSRRHLDRLFAEAFDCTMADYYRKIRLSRARKLVKASNLDFATISSRCGFSSYSHFLQRYREVYGASPTEDRHHVLLDAGDPSRISPSRDLHPFQTQLDPKRMI
ncbi:AraC family transcriptional regulator (plasmid) [Neorhizobium sp. NCHU2750]|nr:AraC family transcriptional regulator [Neorhizobium sp. NCHU2750]